MQLTFITGNKNKFKEARLVIPDLQMKPIDLPEIQELDPRKIIEHKLLQIKEISLDNVVVEDTSLFLNALNGLPGPLFKWFYKALGNEGIYNLLKDKDDKSGKAVCMIGLLTNGEMKFFSAETEGEVVSPRGDNGFGWDQLFIAEGQSKTTAEMSREEKIKVHVRGMAFGKVKKYLENLDS